MIVSTWGARRSSDLNGAAYEQGAVRSRIHPLVERPGERRHFVHKRVLGAAKSFITSGFSPTAAAAGFLRAPRPSAISRRAPIPPQFRRRTTRRAEISARTAVPSAAPRPVTRILSATRTGVRSASLRPVSRLQPVSRQVSRSFAACGPGFVMQNGRCVRRGGLRGLPSRVLDPLGLGQFLVRPQPRETPMARDRGGFQAVEGAFGMPAMVPEEEMRRTLVCPRGMVLGDDELCYPKAVLPRRSKFRKWRGQARPPVTAGDARAIRKAAAAKERVLTLAKSVGLHASKTKPSSGRGRKAAHQHLIAAPAREQLHVISEETN